MKTNASINGELVKKELDLIDTTITRLDTQIQTSKNICIGLWTAWLGWFLKAILGKDSTFDNYWLLFGAVFFPIFFWLMDYYWRKALLSTSLRQNRISVFMNSELGKSWMEGTGKTDFPVLDPVGWLYDNQVYSAVFEKIKGEQNYNADFLTREWKDIVHGKHLKTKNILFYKEAKWFYPVLIFIPIILGILSPCLK